MCLVIHHPRVAPTHIFRRADFFGVSLWNFPQAKLSDPGKKKAGAPTPVAQHAPAAALILTPDDGRAG